MVENKVNYFDYIDKAGFDNDDLLRLAIAFDINELNYYNHLPPEQIFEEYKTLLMNEPSTDNSVRVYILRSYLSLFFSEYNDKIVGFDFEKYYESQNVKYTLAAIYDFYDSYDRKRKGWAFDSQITKTDVVPGEW